VLEHVLTSIFVCLFQGEVCCLASKVEMGRRYEVVVPRIFGRQDPGRDFITSFMA